MSQFEELFQSRPFVEQNGRGQIFLIDGEERTLVNPQIIREQVRETSTNPQRVGRKQLFKLVTVRKIRVTSLGEAQQLFLLNQQRLAEVALQTGQPIPFPQQPPQSEAEIQQTYAVYVDEDLYSDPPIYVFKSSSPVVKAFINATGPSKYDYVVDIAHYDTTEQAPDGTFITRWRLVHIDGKQELAYFLTSDFLPECFQQNFGIGSLTYLGGGSWSGIGFTTDDRINVQGFIPKNAPEGRFKRNFPGSVYGIVYESTTPSYSFTWNRGNLVLNYRAREASETFDIPFTLEKGVIRSEKKSSYSLNHCYRPEQESRLITQLEDTEFCNSQSSYVGSTNSKINSPFQSPDYGTDDLRVSLESYTQEANVIRCAAPNWSSQGALKSSKQNSNLMAVNASSPDSSILIRTKHAPAYGRINHPIEIKTTYGTRGISHFWSYKLWWTYGKVIQTFKAGDDNIYKRDRITNDRRPVDKFGEPFISPTFPNAVETPWDAELPAALFTPSEGQLNFAIVYESPPLIGHQGCYYYHKNPVGGDFYSVAVAAPLDPISQSIGTFSLSGSFIDGTDAVNRLRTAQSSYSQIIGGISGANVVPSLFIGSFVIASQDTNSRLIKSPTPDQQLILRENISIFPNGFDAGYVSDSFDNSNRGVRIEYSISYPSSVEVTAEIVH